MGFLLRGPDEHPNIDCTWDQQRNTDTLAKDYF